MIEVLIVAIIGASATVLAHRFGPGYKVWVDVRRRKLTARLRAVCPHIRITGVGVEKGRWLIEGTMVSPVGMHDYYCVSCGLSGISSLEIVAQPWGYLLEQGFEHFKPQYEKQWKQAKKLSDKLVRLGGAM